MVLENTYIILGEITVLAKDDDEALNKVVQVCKDNKFEFDWTGTYSNE
jgi:hypothetical protein